MTENPAIERLAALLRAGYEIEGDTGDAFMVRHPALRSTGFVYADGLVVFPNGAGEVRFSANAPQAEFHAFVRTIPKPGWRRSVRVPEWIVAVVGMALAVLLVTSMSN